MLCVVGMGLGRLQSQARNSGASDPVTGAIRTVEEPLVMTLTEISNGISDFGSGLFEAGSLKDEVRRLKALEQSAALYTTQVQRYEAEVARLRAMLELPPVPGKSQVPALVVGYFPHEGRATLNVGHAKGVRKNMPVVTAEGLFGIVQTVDRATCQVLLVSSPQLRIVGVVHRDPPPLGFVRGQSAGAMMFEVSDAKAVVQNGDIVFTSGFSDRIPAGIKIGSIVQIDEDEEFGSKRCQVYPGVQVGAVHEVFVLK
jgi:rod shape-determining protein MreC